MKFIRNNFRFPVSDFRCEAAGLRNLKSGIGNRLKNKFFICCLLTAAFCFLPKAACALELADVVSGLQHRYSSVETVSGSFQQTYHGPGIDQEQSGVFWLKKPASMRWEYRDPDSQLFVADGRESFLHVPSDRQVTIQPLNASDLHNTPLEFLIGAADINKGFASSWETEFKPKTVGGTLIRLTPRSIEPAYQYLVLELDPKSFDLRRITVREQTGNTMEFLLSNMTTNIKIDNKKFKFSIPKGVEVIRLDK
jgi:outer membrane lipoprotein carrier protein